MPTINRCGVVFVTLCLAMMLAEGLPDQLRNLKPDPFRPANIPGTP
jgi:hypothetical protein